MSITQPPPSPPTTSSMADRRRIRSIKSRAASIRQRRRRTGLLPKRTSACGCACDGVSKKLERLKKLIPSARSDSGPTAEVAADELFRETADYILRLKAQVVLLQNLIHTYGSPDQVDQNNTV